MAFPIFFLAFSVLAFLFIRDRRSRKRPPLPPGPPADPIIGHLRLIPPVGQDVFFYEMGKIYGDVVHIKVLNQSLIVLNSVQAANDLLDKRGHNYSDRPDFPIFDLWGMGDTLIIASGEEFRVQRRMVQKYFHKEKRNDYRAIQTREARVLAQNLLCDHKNRMELLVRYTTAIIVDVTYGHQIVSNDDPYVKIANACGRAAATSGPPGGTPIDLFPVLKYFPSWFPGTHYANVARSQSQHFQKLKDYPLSQVMEQMNQGTAKPSFLADQLEAFNQEGSPDAATLKRLKAAASIVYIAGAETTSSMLSFFILAMLLYPDCRQRAQAEIDAVVGSDRLPEFYDRKSLPYLECLLQEILRWNHAVPSGVPHRTMEDDIYKGMLIPKGSTIIGNIRSMTLDDSVYKNPFDFDPIRFLPAPAGRGEPYAISPFGFGRRICPGRHLADDSLWIAIATILSTASISKAIGEDGNEITPDVVPITVGVTSQPSPFQCDLKPKNTMASNLLRQITDNV
ncbi:cytochrome P450 [Lyophyllum atratum]|nr:cytochrome P450 [Lyophyllum atratum]